MKKFINLIGLILVAAAAGYSAYWYVLANHAENEFKEQIAQWQKDSNIETISYEKISKEGFPSHINIKLENVKIVAKDTESKDKIEADIAGALTLSVPLWSNLRTVDINGTTTVLFPTSENNPTPPKLVWKGQSTLSVDDKNTNHFEVLKSVFFKSAEENKTKEHAFSFVSLKSHLDEYSFNGNINEKTPLDVKGGQLDLNIKRKDYKKNQEEIVYSLNQKDLVVQVPNTREILSTFYYNPNDFGKIAFDVDGSVCYPSPDQWESISTDPLKPRQAEACIKYDRFNITTDLYNSSSPNFVLSLQQDEAKWNLVLKGTSEGKYTPKYDESVRKTLAILLKDPEFTKDIVGTNPEDQKRLAEATPDIVKLVPELHELGTLSIKVDFLGSTEIKDNIADNIKIDLNQLEYVVPPYILSLIGKATMKKDFQEPEANGTLKITRYKQLIEQLSTFANRVIEVYNKATGGKTSFPITKADDVKKVISFLHAISDDPSKEGSDLRVSFSYNEKDSWKVGTLKLPDFLGKVYELYAALIPASAVPPPAPTERVPAEPAPAKPTPKVNAH